MENGVKLDKINYIGFAILSTSERGYERKEI